MLHRMDFRAMGCGMIAMLDSSSPQAPDLLRQVPDWFEEWEQSLSRFREDSELNQLNRSAGWLFKASPTLWDVFQTALDAELTSDGLVRTTMLDALVNAGYDRSFEQLPFERQSKPIHTWNQASSLAEVTYDDAARTICLPTDVRLDFGGVAKGWAAMQAAQQLGKHGPALISAGGDIAISAELPGGELWPVTIDNPLKPGEIITTVILDKGGVATSGTDYRRWKQGGRWNHHILDPRTGQPAQTDLVSVTVIAPTTTQAETAAKTILILGSQSGMDWLETKPTLSALLVLETGDIICNNKMETHFWRS
jgi:FAD:protein FMN transferase